MRFSISESKYGLLATFTGSITIDDIFHAGNAMMNSSPLGTRCQIFDFLSADLSKIAYEDTRQLALKHFDASREYPNFKLALVTNEGLGTLLATQYKQFSHLLNNLWDIEVFNDRDEALIWSSDRGEHSFTEAIA